VGETPTVSKNETLQQESQKILVGFSQVMAYLEALRRCSADNWGNSTPLSGHQFSKVQKFFIFFPSPFRLSYRGIQPLIPARFALLRRLPHQERRDAGPLVLPVFHDRSLKYLILGVFPHAPFYQNAHGFF